MKKILSFALALSFSLTLSAQIDMQAHVVSDEGRAAYRNYVNYQMDYYSGNYEYAQLILQQGETLFGSLNALMGNTSMIAQVKYDYDALRYAYKKAERDLNQEGNIIGFYDGRSMNGTWDRGTTYNREHVWPQSKGAKKSKPLGYDINSVRPANAKINSSRGNTPFGESANFYDPNEIAINNPNYKPINNGTYRGDCARIIMYDYLTYAQEGDYSNALRYDACDYVKLFGAEKLFESVEIMIKWHMQDPPSITEMVRNDGAEDYQGNRNPLIDFPELAIQVLKDKLTTFTVTSNQTLAPAYNLTTEHGFVAYLTDSEGKHPTNIKVTGATSQYDATIGRLTVTQVTGNVSITTNTPSATPDLETTQVDYYIYAGVLYLRNLNQAKVAVYDLQGREIVNADNVSEDFSVRLSKGAYILKVNTITNKVLL